MSTCVNTQASNRGRSKTSPVPGLPVDHEPPDSVAKISPAPADRRVGGDRVRRHTTHDAGGETVSKVTVSHTEAVRSNAWNKVLNRHFNWEGGGRDAQPLLVHLRAVGVTTKMQVSWRGQNEVLLLVPEPLKIDKIPIKDS